MSCGLVRLICEEPLQPPPGQEGKPLVIDVVEEEVSATVERLHGEGWQFISLWPL